MTKPDDPRHIELGCGNNKRAGFFGIDVAPGPQVDLILDIQRQPLPFRDDSVDYVYSSHTFEHLTGFPFVLREIFRVCRHEATVEIWTPYGKSNDGMLFGHYTFLTETSFKHICFEYDRFYLGECAGYFDWFRTHYNLYPGIVEELRQLGIPLGFAMEHLFNICLEWGVFLKVRKDSQRAPGPQAPERVYSYGRSAIVQQSGSLRWRLSRLDQYRRSHGTAKTAGLVVRRLLGRR
jgi:SAM-dependent methyltransferase